MFGNGVQSRLWAGVFFLSVFVSVLFLVLPLLESQETVTQIAFEQEVLGPEGEPNELAPEAVMTTDTTERVQAIAVRSGWENYRPINKQEVEQAKADVQCQIPEGILSPTGHMPNMANYHWKTNSDGELDYARMKSLDWGAKFGSQIYAPFSGEVTYVRRTQPNACGNQIILSGPTGTISLCHVKDFVDDQGLYVQGREVTQGQVIGHSGGKCCLGQAVPKNWVTECQAEGVMCNDPTQPEACQCQPALETGNVTGPHVHTTLKSGGNILSCLL